MPPVIVLAGGLGTRLREITGDRYAKPMVPVPCGGTDAPFLAFVLGHLRAQGCGEFVLCIGHHGDSIRRHFGDGRRYGLHLVYDDRGAAQTAARVMHAAGRLDAAEFLVVCGDTYHPLDLPAFLAEFRRRPQALAQLALVDAGGDGAANVACDDDGTVLAYDAGGVTGARCGVEAGTLTIRRTAFASLPLRPALSLTDDLYPALIGDRQLHACHSAAPFFDVGTPAGYRRFCAYAARGAAVPVAAADG